MRLRCRIGRHRWDVHRYWSIGGLLVEGRVCEDCKLTHRDRTVVYRPGDEPAFDEERDD